MPGPENTDVPATHLQCEIERIPIEEDVDRGDEDDANEHSAIPTMEHLRQQS